MSIGRYLVTLAIAAFASLLVYLIVRDFQTILLLIDQGDPQLMAGHLSQAIVGFLVSYVGFALIGYLSWRLISLVFLRPASGQKPMRSYLVAGVISHALLFALFAILYAFGAQGFEQSGLALSLFAVICAGCIWGSVFWLMDPRAHKDKLVAEDFA